MAETEPTFDDVEVTEIPKNDQKDAKVVRVEKGTIRELWDVKDDSNFEYGSIDDVIVQITAIVEYNGKEIEVQDNFRFYEQPTDRTDFGKYLQRYGKPKKGQEVTFDFDKDGNASLIL